uniref:anthranilate synthase component 2 n=1 Tax=Madagascaria erythrocladioides TaxID=753684 RepID=UPI001BEFBC7A|nr:anthranilate synthase component 2 [Madagascaria erythrocladioides]QUE28933.1 trpG [Madagascaria erythrocladioides]UNJ16481.1 anthranilate synthase component 2 [Madagascaria erythrocladioides]
MILIIDNYDSFTYNLVQYVGEMGYKLHVVRNNKITIDEIFDLRPQKIIISPGPGSPQESGISLEIIKKFGSIIPILGVCLGHQSIGQVYGAAIVKAQEIKHGKISNIYHTNKTPLFKGVTNPFVATRYHSLVIDTVNLPNELEVIATTDDNIIMSVRHKTYKSVYGIQFHPESILTVAGKTILKNFLQIAE